MNQLITVPSGAVHVEWRGTWAIVRTWLHPLGLSEPDTGQPLKKWNWAVAVEPHGTDLEILAMHDMPLWPSFAELQQAMASIGFRRFVWEKVGKRGRRSRSLLLPSASLPVQTFQSTAPTRHRNSTAPEIRISAPCLSRPNQQQNNMSNPIDNKVTLHIGPIVTSGPNGIENVFLGNVIGNLTGEEAARTVQDLANAIAPYNHVTGEALEE